MMNLIFVVVSLVTAFVLTLTATGNLSRYLELDLAVGPLVVGWPLLLCAWPLYLWSFQRLTQSGQRRWIVPLVGAVFFPIPAAVGFLPEVFDPGGVERLRVGLLEPPLVIGVYLNYALFGFILGVLYTARQRARPSTSS
jgi:hypothetical protein